jgi:SAM-dependent methyltransferase
MSYFSGSYGMEAMLYYGNNYYPRRNMNYRNYNLELTNKFGILPGMKVLDAGCGYGNFLQAVNESGAHAYGIDIAPEPIRHCLNNIDGEFRVASLDRLPYLSQSFDAVTCMGVLEHEENKHAVLYELRRVSKKRVVIEVPISEYLLRTFGYAGTEQAEYREDVLSFYEWENLIKSCDLKIIKVFKDTHFFTADWIGAKGIFAAPFRFFIALLTVLLPLKSTYQVFFVCEKREQ